MSKIIEPFPPKEICNKIKCRPKKYAEDLMCTCKTTMLKSRSGKVECLHEVMDAPDLEDEDA